jgi:hypothetical protein
MAAKPQSQHARVARPFEVENTLEHIFDFFDDCYDKGWTDGLPVFPPTQQALSRMLACTDRARDDAVGVIPPLNGVATIEKIAINAIMAGCRPEYLPVVITAVEAMLHPDYNLYGRQTTTHPGAHLMIVHGPVRNELDVNCRAGVLGHGWRANATMGRALRLLLINVGGNKPGITDMATHGHPGKYSYTMGEDEEHSPWTPFHVDRGYAREVSAVTMLCAEAPHNINDQKSKTPERYLGSAASAMCHLGANGLYRSGLKSEQMLVIPAETAQWLHDHGWSKRDVREYLFQEARQPVHLMRERGGWDMSPLPTFVDRNDDNAMVPVVPTADDLLIVVAGGFQRHMNFIPTAGYNLSVTRAIVRKDGTPVSSLREITGGTP